MPRPPARRTRTAHQGPAASTKTAGKPNERRNPSDTKIDSPSNGSERQAPTTTPEKAAITNVDTSHSHQLPMRPVLTPTRNSHEDAIASSPGERPETGSRPPTRSRGYSSTLSLAGRKGDVASRIGSTPGFESSILSNFRRRPRQPSLLQMMQADESSDFDDDDFLGGLSPEDESTPLNITKPSQTANSPHVSPSRGPVLPSSASGESRKRKHSSLNLGENEGPSSEENSPLSSPIRTPRPHSTLASVDTTNSISATPLSSPGSIQLTNAAIDERLMGPDRNQGTWIRQGTSGALPKIATSILQTKFLPRRRIRRRQQTRGPNSDEDLDSLPEDSDEDELTRGIGSMRRRPQKKGLSDVTPRNANLKIGSSDRSNKKAKGVKATFPNLPDPQSKTPRTYSRRETLAVDKENYISDYSDLSSPPPSDEFDSDTDTPVRSFSSRITSHELEQAVLKFKEVDKWKMEFEDVSFF